MSAHGLPVMFGVVALVLLGSTGSTPVPAERNIPLSPFEMSAVQRDMAEIPGDRTRRGGGDGGDWLLLPSTSEKLSAASLLHKKRSTYFHSSTIKPIMAGLPGDRPGGRGGTKRVANIPHTSSRSTPYRAVTHAPTRSGNGKERPSVPGTGHRGGAWRNKQKPIEQSGSVSGPLLQEEDMCETRVRGVCRTLTGGNKASRQESDSENKSEDDEK